VNGARNLSLTDVGISLLLIAVALLISFRERMRLERSLIVGTARTVVQLSVVGYVLAWVFHADRWYWTALYLVFMAAVATQTAVGRQDRRIPGLTALMTVSISGSGFFVLAVVIGLVVRPSRWYEPQYTIPLAGMILGNALTGATLAVERLTSEIRGNRLAIEAALSLGATARQAAEAPVRAAVKAALLPTINAMMVVGLVQLPGMMTGQILAGAPPEQAVRYQMVVMFMISAAVALTSAFAALLAQRACFTPAHQLREEIVGN
jgi:putative ABC transport system permease protein